MNETPYHLKMNFDLMYRCYCNCFTVSKARKQLMWIPGQQVQNKYITKQVNLIIVQTAGECVNKNT